jgi:hypothetical protein
MYDCPCKLLIADINKELELLFPTALEIICSVFFRFWVMFISFLQLDADADVEIGAHKACAVADIYHHIPFKHKGCPPLMPRKHF